jgi:hypothetical protein
MSKRKLPEINKKIFPYDLVIAWWEDIVADSIWVDIPDINFESNNEIKQGGGHTTIPTKNILKIKKIKI